MSAHGHGHGHDDHGGNKKTAIVISILALFLAFSEAVGKSAQTDGLNANIEASNLWSFYQAKTIRQSALRGFSEAMSVDAGLARDPAVKEALQKRIAQWNATIDRWESEPGVDGKPGEGRKELVPRATKAQEKRDISFAKYHLYEFASVAFQIAIVLASASIIAGMVQLLWAAYGLGGIGAVLLALGLFAPQLMLHH